MGKMGHRKAKRKNVGQKTRNYQKLGERNDTYSASELSEETKLAYILISDF